MFEDFREMFLFAHLEQIYRDRAWIIVDGDQAGKDLVGKLQRNFPSWPSSHFKHWNHEQFEQYYPAEFSDQVNAVFGIQDIRQRREAKKDLLDRVIEWIEQDTGRARIEFEQSAGEVIAVLQEVESELKNI